MTNDWVTRKLIDAIISLDPSTKGELGRRAAAHLGLEPGRVGKDGGIDGVGFLEGSKIYFQSKLESQPLDADYADNLYAKLVRHRADIGVVLSATGYTRGFEPRLKEFEEIHTNVYHRKWIKIHLLNLYDYFNETSVFEQAIKDLPPLRNLGIEKWLQ
ncbi:restriction endonuclease [Iningainema tapete]|uniref:Restriction endonuclease n=1 Tax=Iningainema tapete BLCC-T55 TaxID=2748662 RepID=A0A8J6XIF3_9CYAN|nr:restriction endonuclease [Iningainema tapete]MBD2777410.1 restriction endonuclease [Iningainema tapete BLCC-T55]